MRYCLYYAARHLFSPNNTLYVNDMNVTDGVILKGNFNANELHENEISNVPASIMQDKLLCPELLLCVEECCGSSICPDFRHSAM